MNVSRLKPLALALAACAYSVSGLQVALADDTEIYVPKEVPPDQQVRPNILLVLDTSGSMTTRVSGTSIKVGNTTRTMERIEVLRDVVYNLVDDLKDQNVNLGFMRFHGSDGGAVTRALGQLTPTNAAGFKQQITNTIKAGGNTPMSETYYEAYLYLAGKTPYWPKQTTNARNGTDLKALQGNQVHNYPHSWVYDSPISHSCQKTHIVYITDGAPVSDNSSNTAIRNLIKNARNPQNQLTNTEYTWTSCNTGNGQCLPHLAEYMYNQDMGAEAGYPKKFSDPTNRRQNVTSHFVGFALDLPLLQNAARVGGGHYFTSSTASGLAEALNSIIVDITAENTTFVAPSIAVTAYNNFGFRDELYYALFRPAEGTKWLGNLKKYRLKTKDNNDKPITPVVVDANGTAAISDETGFFKENSKSYWSNSVDGDDVGKGGFAGTLTSGQRKIYTWYGADRAPGVSNSEALKVLSSNGTTHSGANTSNIPNSALGASNNSERTTILNWIKGLDETGAQRRAIGDVLHNEPRLVSYITDEDIVRAEGAGSLEDITVYIGTNEGFIHAVDAKTGKEQFAFLPKELQGVPNKYRKNDKGYNNKAYGMDGHFTVWTEYGDRRSNSTRLATKVNLYAGMRRGGSNYYALDVLNVDQPRLKWVIKGATNPVAERTPGFDKLGLTFSAARLGEIMVGGVRTKVLVFSGGYDPDHDEIGNNLPRDDGLGNALYVVNADTGELIWRATKNNASGTHSDIVGKTQLISEMTNSMPASPAVLDVDGDGLIDIIYASDLRGQLFRFDVNNGGSGSTLLKGQLFAKLGGSSKADNRRFFTTPDVALIRDKGKAPYYTVSLGSGFRESPLNEETNDRFYMIRDFHVSSALPAEFTPLTENNLTDASGLAGDDFPSVQAQVEAYQAQIDALTDAVTAKEAAFQQLKDASGFSAAYNEYVAQLQLAQDLQEDIDIQTQVPYGVFDVSLADSTTPYNSGYLEQHASEYGDQAQVQQILLQLQEALDGSVAPVDEVLANAYQSIFELQEAAVEAQNKRVQKENFILKGHLEPELNQSLRDEIADLFPGVDISGDDDGDFSDLAYLLDKALTDDYEQGYPERSHLLGVAGLEEALAALQSDPGDSALLDSWVVAVSGGTNGLDLNEHSGDAFEILAQDASGQTLAMQEKAELFGAPQAIIDDKRVDLEAALLAASEATALANAIAGNPTHNFADAEAAVEAAYMATRHPATGIYALRVKINEEYGKLDVADSQMTAEQLAALRDSSGFFVRLMPGEKVLSDSISFNGSVLFSTFTPRGQSVSECGSDVGVGRTFALNLRTAEGVFTEELPNGEVKYVRSQLNKQAGIPPTPVVVITEGDPEQPKGLECEGGICTEPGGSPITPTHWREEEVAE